MTCSENQIHEPWKPIYRNVLGIIGKFASKKALCSRYILENYNRITTTVPAKGTGAVVPGTRDYVCQTIFFASTRYMYVIRLVVPIRRLEARHPTSSPKSTTLVPVVCMTYAYDGNNLSHGTYRRYSISRVEQLRPHSPDDKTLLLARPAEQESSPSFLL